MREEDKKREKILMSSLDELRRYEWKEKKQREAGKGSAHKTIKDNMRSLHQMKQATEC